MVRMVRKQEPDSARALLCFLSAGNSGQGPGGTVFRRSHSTDLHCPEARLAGTLWIPGIALFLVVALPWYIAVQLRNPEFFRVFILEHNLGRFSHDLYHHRQPFWFYIPVLLLMLMPWTLWLVLAVVQRLRRLFSEGKKAFASTEDSWQLFLLLWLVVPVVFFSASQSKLPGYILPAIPAGTLLVAEFLASRREKDVQSADAKLPPTIAVLHSVLCGALVFLALSTPALLLNHHLTWGPGSYLATSLGAVVAIGMAVVLLSRSGPRLLRDTTLVAVVLGVAAILKLASPAIDATISARPIAQTIQDFSHEVVPLVVFGTNAQQQYGLEFYLNRPAQFYGPLGCPREAHVLVIIANSPLEFAKILPGRRVSYLTSFPAQKLELYWVGAAP